MATTDSRTRYWRKHYLGMIFHGNDVLDGYVPLDTWMPAWEHVAGSYDPTNAGAALNVHVSLHTASPGEGGTQATNEVAGAFYARLAILRYSGAAGWRLDDSDTANPFAENRQAVTWAKNTTGSPIVVTHIGVGRDAAGAGLLIGAMALEDASGVPTPVTIPVGASFSLGAGGIRIFAR